MWLQHFGSKKLTQQERIERAVPRNDGNDKKGGYPAGPKPANGVPPVPPGLRKPRTQA